MDEEEVEIEDFYATMFNHGSTTVQPITNKPIN